MSTLNMKNLFLDLQTQMLSKLKTNENITHQGVRGTATEINWVGWLRTYLPKRYCIDKAIIIDCYGNCSDEIDAVIYDQHFSPLIFNQDNSIYIPAESVYAVFEIKPTLTREYIKYAGEKAKSVRTLHRTSSEIIHAGGITEPKELHEIYAGILTSKCHWKETFGFAFQRTLFELDEISRLNIGCVLESGSFICDYSSEFPSLKKSTPEESLIFFFLNLFNSIRKIGSVPAIDIRTYALPLDSEF